METNFIIADSGMHKVLNLLKTTKRGSILTIADFEKIKGLSYTHTRTILVTLCERNVLIRVARGVYCYPIIENGAPVIPSIDATLSKIAKQENWEICPAGEYAKYLLGIRETMPNDIVCYNNGKVKTINFENGVSAKIMPSKKYFTPFIKDVNLRMLINYISHIGINNISELDKVKLLEFYNNLDKDIVNETVKVAPEINIFLK